MKKQYSLAVILFFSIIYGSFAQTKNDILLQKQREIKEWEQRNGQNQKSTPGKTDNNINPSAIKPVLEVGGKLYDIAKAEGRLAHYELVQKEGKIVSITKTDYTKLSPQTSTLTPCDIIPPGTIPAFGSLVDDATSSLITLPFNFCFYGNNYNQVRMSTNGNIQFPPTNNTAFSSVGFPAPNDLMIAPFWSDVDIRGTGTCTYDVFATYAVFSWINVGYYNTHSDLINDFQMVITDGLDPILPPGKNVGFYYGTMQWTTGDASDGDNGFPDPMVTPAIPATVGANAGNGVDYFLIGRFGQPGNAYDGPLGANDGVSWLDGKRFFFNACPPVGANQEPLNLTGGYCDTLKVCGNDTLYKKYTFSAPEVTQAVTITASAPTLGGAFTYSVLPSANSTDVFMIIDGSLAPGGYHTVTMTATDNGSPVLSSVQSFVVYVNQAALSNLSGSIVLNPTLGACPGGVVTASVSLGGGIPDGYLWSNNQTTPSTTYTTVVAADSLIFVTLSSGQCQKSIVGHININPVPVVSISGNTSFCSGNASGTVLTATNTLNPATQGPHSYNWAGTGTIGSANSASTTLTAGNYTVTVTNQFGCFSSAVTTVVLNESPKFTLTSSNAISGGSVYCVNQDTARIKINFAASSTAICGPAAVNCFASTTKTVGTGTGNSNTTAVSPFTCLWARSRHQYLIRATELTAAGLVAGKISALSFIVNTTGTQTNYPNYTVKMKCTSANVVSTNLDNVGLTQVFNTSNLNITTGINTLNFNQSYIWDGISNILVDVCHNGVPTNGTNASIGITAAGFAASAANYDDNAGSLCGISGTYSGTANNRPRFIFNTCLAQQTGSQFNVTVTPTVGVSIPAAHDSIKIDLPSSPATTCYTVTLTNPLGGCFKDTVICINATQGVTQATLNTSSAVVCPSETITLSPSGTITSYTISYTDVSGPQVSVNAPVTFTPSNTPGIFVYTLSATAPCGGPLTDFTTTVNVAQGITQGTLTASSASVCPGSTVTLSTLGTLDTYTITYVDDSGTPQSAVNSNPTFTVSSLANPQFGIHTYTLQAYGSCGGPLDTFYVDVTVIQGVTQGTLTTTSASVCPGSSVTLGTMGALDTYTIQYTDDSGLHTSVNSTVTVIPTGTTSPVFGIHTYSLIAQGPCSGPIDTFYVDVTVIQGVTQGTLAASSASVCPGSPVTLNAFGALNTYTIVYTDDSGTQAVANAPVTFTPTGLSGPAYGVHTYTLLAEGPCNGPLTAFTTTVEVIQGVTQGTLSASTPSVCPGSPVTLSALGTLDSYTITYVDGTGTHTSVNNPVTFNPSTTSVPDFGIHTYSLSAVGPCSGPLTVFTTTVEIIQGTSQATLTATPNAVCIGSPVTLSVTGSLATYTIMYNNGAGITNSVNSPVTYNTNMAGVNTYTVMAQGFCSAPVTPFVTTASVTALATLTIAPMPNMVKCLSGSSVLTANVGSSTPGNPGAPYSYFWAANGSPAVGTNTAQSYTSNAAITTTYVVTVTGPCATQATSSVVVSNFVNDISVSIIDSAAVCANTELMLHATGSGGVPNYSFNWVLLPGSGSIGVGSELNTSAPGTEGTYTIAVVVSDSCGYTDMDMQLVTVMPPCDIVIPNIITPNGDGANEAFKIKNLEYHPNTSLSIFDRWGRKVYESTNYNNDWRGDGMNDGTFFYILDVPDDKKYSGYLTIFKGN